MLSGLNTNSYTTNRRQQPSFTRAPANPFVKPFTKVFGNKYVTKVLDTVKSNLMIEIVGLDLATMVIPRTIIAAKQNPDYAVETCGRELLPEPFNPLGPSIVSGLMLGALGLHGVTASKKNIENHYHAWQKAGGDEFVVPTKEKPLTKADRLKRFKIVRDYNKEVLSNMEGNLGDVRKGNEFRKLSKGEINYLASRNAVITLRDLDKKATGEFIGKQAAKITELTGLEGSEYNNIKIKLKDKIKTTSTSSLTNDLIHLPQKIFTKHAPGAPLQKEMKNVFKLVNTKSVLGLAFSFAGLTALPFFTNWLTKARTGSKAYCAYTDFRSMKDDPKKDKKKKGKLLRAKAMGLAGLGFLVALTTGGLAGKGKFWGHGGIDNLKNVLTLKGPHAHRDMLKFIYASNIAARITASRDEEEVKVTSLRDSSSFMNWLVLGGVVGKGIAHALDPKGLSFVNVKGPLKVKGKTPLHTAFYTTVNWFRNLSQKTNGEMDAMGRRLNLSPEKLKFNKTALNACTLGGLTWSLVTLGIGMPVLNNYMANQARKKQLEAKKNGLCFPQGGGVHYSFKNLNPNPYDDFLARRKRFSHA